MAIQLKIDRVLQGSFDLKALNLLFIFQVNCPGCFLYGFPRVNKLRLKYHQSGLNVLGLSTAFEDFEYNTAANTELLLARSQGKIRLLLTVLSLDTPTCSTSIRTFSQRLNSLAQELTALVEVSLISADLPFAQSRWQAIEEIDHITMLSDYRDMDFARNWGLLIQEWGLLARAVYVVDRADIVTYREVVSDLTIEPNYQAAMEALQAIT